MGKTNKGNCKTMTPSERLKAYRQNIKSDPIRYEEYLRKERERYQKRKESGQIKMVKDLNDRDKRKKRKSWRKSKKVQREKEKTFKTLFNNLQTPPQTPEHSADYDIRIQNPVRQHPNPSYRSAQHQRGRKKVKKSKSAAYRKIAVLEKLIIKKQQEADRYRKRYERLKQKVDTKQHENNSQTSSPRKKTKEQLKGSKVTKEVERHMLFHNALIQELKTRFKELENERDKQVFSKVITGKILRKYRMTTMALKYVGIPYGRHRANQGRSKKLVFEKKQKRTTKRNTLGQKVQEFLEEDVNSRQLPGKKDTKTKNKEKRQKRILSDTMKNLHKKFLSENEAVNLSYTSFLRLRPFWIVTPKVSERDTCVCKLHTNMQFMVTKLYQEKVVRSKDMIECVSEIVCDTQNKECMYRECEECKTKELEVVNPEVDNEFEKQVYVDEWVNRTEERTKYKANGEQEVFNVSIVVKETKQMSIRHLLEDANSLMSKFSRHIFNIRNQHVKMKTLKQELCPQECLIHIDFSENYACKLPEETQGMHFGGSRSQVSLHTGVLYIAETQPMSFCTVSECTRHDPIAIWSHLKPVLDSIKTDHPDISTVLFLSDGPTTQYRSKSNFYLMCAKMAEYGFKTATWNFSEASHGKGAPDGVGGVIKRTADRLVAEGNDIPNCDKFMAELTKTGVNVKLYRITESDIINLKPKLPAVLKRVPDTMKLHQIKWKKDIKNQIHTKTLSCLCRDVCECYDDKIHTFPEIDCDQDLVDEREEHDVSAPVESVEKSDQVTNADGLRTVDHLDEELVGQWCVVLYKERAYPGIIKEVDIDSVEVTCMHIIGNNRYFWPLLDDTIWYEFDKVASLIPKPEKVTKTGRHFQIAPEIYKLIVKRYNLD